MVLRAESVRLLRAGGERKHLWGAGKKPGNLGVRVEGLGFRV